VFPITSARRSLPPLDTLRLVVLVHDIPAVPLSDAEAVWARNGIDFSEPPFRLINDGGDAVGQSKSFTLP
jgi:hypothetical protein